MSSTITQTKIAEQEVENTIKDVKNLERISKQAQKQAVANAKSFISGIQHSRFSNEFTGYDVNTLANSSHNAQHRSAQKLLNSAAAKTVKIVNKFSDPDDLMGFFEGQVTDIETARSNFGYYDEDPDVAHADADNIRFLDETKAPYVTLINGGDVKNVDWDDINVELDALQNRF